MGVNASLPFFLELFEEFKKLSPTKINAYLTIAQGRVPLSVWKANTAYAQALLTAHMLTTQGRQGDGAGGGAVTNEQVGDLSRAFATCFDATAGDSVLRTTRYGIDFIALRKETIVTGMTTRGFVRRPWC